MEVILSTVRAKLVRYLNAGKRKFHNNNDNDNGSNTNSTKMEEEGAIAPHQQKLTNTRLKRNVQPRTTRKIDKRDIQQHDDQDRLLPRETYPFRGYKTLTNST